jgi:hypothetical protein
MLPSCRSPKHGINAEFMRLLDQATDIVTDDFAEDFVDHRDIPDRARIVP